MKILKRLTHFPIFVACAAGYQFALARNSLFAHRIATNSTHSLYRIASFFDGVLSHGFHLPVINPAVSWIKLRLSLRNLLTHSPDVAREPGF
ncbi:hypothetical protein [Cellvibrio polysaccharolyticus]|uniref:hypothetical protein n=1 Tax=Cellvibrio polysaccharolyticus TaxID=2082724 RepID=UPI00187F0BF4|nr:hypothetical protein [Cellvibrio polysaccharolyticus]